MTTETNSMLREYRTPKEFDRESQSLIASGWRIESISEIPQKPGVKRFATMGIMALFVKPKPITQVLYVRRELGQ